MAFWQLYYTSCESGLAGYGGYQFNAATPGVPARTMRDVEDGTVYEPPRELLAVPPDDLDAYPVAFSHTVGEAGDATITARVVFAGDDYSGRPGNYFAHALVTETSEADFGPLLPVELWGAGFWRRTPVAGPDLPAMPGPPPRGVIDRLETQLFLDGQRAHDVLPVLLSAVITAMAGDRPVLLAGRDATENAWWVAAVSYLLGDRLARRLSFTTYSHRPGYSRHHVVGVLSGVLPSDAEHGFHLFDLATGRTPELPVHPLAYLLARTGVMATAGLWRQAGAFAAGGEDGFDAWYPPVAAAAALLGGRLEPGDIDAVAAWLPTAGRDLPDQHAGMVLDMLLGLPEGALADRRVRDLLPIASRLGLDQRVERLERILVGRTFGRGEPVRITSPAVLRETRERAGLELSGRTPEDALSLLAWAEASGAAPPDTDLVRFGHGLDPMAGRQVLAALFDGRPAIVRGLLERLAAMPAGESGSLLAGPLGELLRRDDLARHPALVELWLLGCVDRGAMAAFEAFDHVRDLRAAATGGAPLVDAALLTRLWPHGCPPERFTDLLDAVADDPGPGVLDWLARELSALREKKGDHWLKATAAMADHPILDRMPDDVRSGVRRTSGLKSLLGRAAREVPAGETAVLAELYAEYERGDDQVRRMLRRALCGLLSKADPLGRAVRGCPHEVLETFCDELGRRLSPLRADVPLAARVFIALGDFDVLGGPLEGQLTTAFEYVRRWRRRDIGALAQALEGDRDAMNRFEAWREERRPLRWFGGKGARRGGKG